MSVEPVLLFMNSHDHAVNHEDHDLKVLEYMQYVILPVAEAKIINGSLLLRHP